jgi:L-aminopeptidase/D-esterase-like protein
MAVVPGLRVGHATDAEARTGCTVLLGPFRGASHTAGHATGSREIDPLSPLHVVPRIDALLLTGGSAFGLAAAEGVVQWLEERGIGYETGAARVPIVPAAVIYDLAVGRSDRRPDAAMGRAACDAASEAMPAEGAVGAGTGATAGKVLGRDNASRGGFGVAAASHSG